MIRWRKTYLTKRLANEVGSMKESRFGDIDIMLQFSGGSPVPSLTTRLHRYIRSFNVNLLDFYELLLSLWDCDN